MKKTLLMAILLTSVFAQAGYTTDGRYISADDERAREEAAHERRAQQVRLNQDKELVDGNDNLILKTQQEAIQACRSLSKKLPTLRELAQMNGQLLTEAEYDRQVRDSGYRGTELQSVLNPGASGGVADTVYYNLYGGNLIFPFQSESDAYWSSSTTDYSDDGIAFSDRHYVVSRDTKLKVKCK